jgi:hypothetical protein
MNEKYIPNLSQAELLQDSAASARLRLLLDQFDFDDILRHYS